MGSPILNNGNEFINIDGFLVEKKSHDIVVKIKEYDEDLELLCLDPARADSVSEAPFVLVEKCKDGQYRRIKDYWHLNEGILADIEAADSQRHDLIAVINGRNERVKKERDRRYKELREEQIEIVKHIAGMKSRTSVRDPRTGEKIEFYDDRPAVRGDEKIKGRKNF